MCIAVGGRGVNQLPDIQQSYFEGAETNLVEIHIKFDTRVTVVEIVLDDVNQGRDSVEAGACKVMDTFAGTVGSCNAGLGAALAPGPVGTKTSYRKPSQRRKDGAKKGRKEAAKKGRKEAVKKWRREREKRARKK